MLDDLPPFLTVEQAARQLQLGRSKAYELTVEWERTAGRSGLPFVWFGHQKRIPTNWLIHHRLVAVWPAGGVAHSSTLWRPTATSEALSCDSVPAR